jgi:hypothetical protein
MMDADRRYGAGQNVRGSEHRVQTLGQHRTGTLRSGHMLFNPGSYRDT